MRILYNSVYDKSLTGTLISRVCLRDDNDFGTVTLFLLDYDLSSGAWYEVRGLTKAKGESLVRELTTSGFLNLEDYEVFELPYDGAANEDESN